MRQKSGSRLKWSGRIWEHRGLGASCGRVANFNTVLGAFQRWRPRQSVERLVAKPLWAAQAGRLAWEWDARTKNGLVYGRE
jgi:hypothetical protein